MTSDNTNQVFLLSQTLILINLKIHLLIVLEYNFIIYSLKVYGEMFCLFMYPIHQPILIIIISYLTLQLIEKESGRFLFVVTTEPSGFIKSSSISLFNVPQSPAKVTTEYMYMLLKSKKIHDKALIQPFWDSQICNLEKNYETFEYLSNKYDY